MNENPSTLGEYLKRRKESEIKNAD